MKIPYRTKTKTIDLADLSPDDILAEDIAYSLAGQSRYNGNTRPLYTVAQHSVLCCLVAPQEFKLAALLHDAHEYIIGDIATPAQRLLEMICKNHVMLSNMRSWIDVEIADAFKIDINEFYHPTVREIDARMLATETLFFFGENYNGREPYTGMLTDVWTPKTAEMEFLFELERWTS